ncbi:hypothetical protein ACLS0R_19275, partial [Comamonas jiangduensis]|uniref:hypothetical protein n=1 Tax=Comamonas jiangduensis TaxID=1194168 RepID=UPI003BF7DF83
RLSGNYAQNLMLEMKYQFGMVSQDLMLELKQAKRELNQQINELRAEKAVLLKKLTERSPQASLVFGVEDATSSR